MGRWQSGQMQLTVNQPSFDYTGSNPVLPIFYGPLAQLARAPALQAGGQGFESLKVHFISSHSSTG